MGMVYSFVCDYCSNQVQIPHACEEDSFFYKKNSTTQEPLESESHGFSMDVLFLPLKSHENYRKRETTKTINYTFCGKECFLEFIKKNLTEKGKLK